MNTTTFGALPKGARFYKMGSTYTKESAWAARRDDTRAVETLYATDYVITTPTVVGTAEGNATEGRVYGGDCGLVHIADGERRNMGKRLAASLDSMMRADARLTGARTQAEADAQDLCPGCYMVAGFNTMVELAKQNNQSLQELGFSMARAFMALAEGGEEEIEEINVVLDEAGDQQDYSLGYPGGPHELG